jgi:CRP/FNR family transcriptional regulator
MIEYANFFSQLNKQHQFQLLELAVTRQFIHDELIDNLGGQSESVYVVTNGRVKISELTAEGKEVILWFCGTGELFGFAETLVASTFSGHQVHAQACGRGEVLVIGKTDFEHFIMDNPGAVLPVVQLLGFRLREISEVLMDVTSSDVTSRVIRLLYRLGGLYGKSVNKGLRIDLPITHQEMADMIGTSRQTVTTVLGELKRKGLIETEQRTIVICNMDLMQCLLQRPNTLNVLRRTATTSQLAETEH